MPLSSFTPTMPPAFSATISAPATVRTEEESTVPKLSPTTPPAFWVARSEACNSVSTEVTTESATLIPTAPPAIGVEAAGVVATVVEPTFKVMAEPKVGAAYRYALMTGE